ncbi:MAG: DNA polymerase III subunit gamma/tau, partial [Pseudomonadota bacterium]
KVPVTVLSRCQRFDLRRIEPETMIGLLRKIADAEGAAITDPALALITRAAEGSARDATSLLDQAISHGAGETSADQVRAMLGLADRGRVLDLFDLVMKGDVAGALAEVSTQYAEGADPMAVLRDLAEITHWVSVVKITPDAADDPTIGPDERTRGTEMAAALPMRVLTRTWQMLLKALEEVNAAPNAMMAAEMAIIRLTHVADLPSPEEIARKLNDSPLPARTDTPRTRSNAAPAGQSAAPVATTPVTSHPQAMPSGPTNQGGGATALAPQADAALARYPTFEHVIELIRTNRDQKLLIDVKSTLRLAAYRPGRIEFVPTDDAPKDLAQRLGGALSRWTGNRWAVSVVNEGGGQTIEEVEGAAHRQAVTEARAHPLVQAVFDAFPKAEIETIRTPEQIASQAEADALPEVDDEWDPFEAD